MEIAKVAAMKSNCQSRKVGTAIVQDKRVIALGYNGVPSGVAHCEKCEKDPGNLWECHALHAEENAIISCAMYGISTIGSSMYTTLQPCYHCSKMILQSGIRSVIYLEEYPSDIKGLELLNQYSVMVFKLNELMEFNSEVR
jgi:dCMP deaminase